MKNPSTNRANAYKEAGRLLAERALGGWGSPLAVIEYGCEALEVAHGYEEGIKLAADMKEIFCSGESIAWLADGKETNVETERPIRVLAFCFMAAMVEAGDA